MYIKGSLCVSGNSSPFILQPTGTTQTVTVYIGKKFKSSSNASPIGTSAAPIHLATIVGGCIDANHGSSPNYTVGRVQQAGEPPEQHEQPLVRLRRIRRPRIDEYSSTQNDIPKPTIDTAWYSNAKPGPARRLRHGIDLPEPRYWTATQFKNAVLDNDSTRNTSLGTVGRSRSSNQASGAAATHPTASTASRYDADGNLIGELRWDYPAAAAASATGERHSRPHDQRHGLHRRQPLLRRLRLRRLPGSGTIYVNGTVTFTNGAKVCAKAISGARAPETSTPTTNLLEIVAVNAGNVSPGFNSPGAGTYEGVSFVNGLFNAATGSNVNGPVIADRATMSGNAKLRTTVNPPGGAPGASSTTTTTGPAQAAWAVVPGSWQQLK